MSNITTFLTVAAIWLFLPLIILAWLPFYLARCGVKILAMLLRRDLISMLAPIDGIFSHDEIHTCPLNAIIGSVELEGDVDLDLIRETMRTNVLEARTESNKLLYPELGWTIEHWLGFPFWKEASLFLHDRIWLHPSNMRDHEVANFQTQLTFKPFKINQPLWEVVIVRKASSSIFELMFRFHHSVSDGAGILHMLGKMRIPQGPDAVWEKPRKSEHLSLLRYLSMPYDYVKTRREVSRTVGLVRNEMRFDDELSCSEAAARLRFHSSGSIPFSVIRKIGEKYNVGGVAVMHSAMLGAVRMSCFAKGGPIPATVAVETAILPPWERERPLGNHVTHGMYAAPLGELDSRKRILRTQQALTEMKRSTYSVTVALIVQALASLPRPIVAQIYRNDSKEQKIFVGNLPGPEYLSNFCGYVAKNVTVRAGFYARYSGLGVGLISFGGNLRFGVIANDHVLSKPGQAEEITRLFLAELGNLVE
ncbi:putative diacyglycerol O-acyltransferase MT3172 isoform X1 [Folsomia candida]|uniref:putative diacyglycerol O-acyltransferase MT3172 isoform X1 n=1 Tax=Folsomia candida TaxID=158441 RepID=UPI001604C7AD|nr:putative diacyglycerol O-acyltransferase MT3172 isoform X1 [Folsomia candida]